MLRAHIHIKVNQELTLTYIVANNINGIDGRGTTVHMVAMLAGVTDNRKSNTL